MLEVGVHVPPNAGLGTAARDEIIRKPRPLALAP
jgi:hypothetical protein